MIAGTMSNATSSTCSNEDLVQKARIDFTDKDQLFQKLLTMQQKFELAKKDEDDEPTLVLKCLIEKLEWLEKIYKESDKSAYVSKIYDDQLNEVKSRLADLKQKLKVRHGLSFEKHDNTMKVETNESEAPNSDTDLKLPEIPTKISSYISLRKDSDKWISCDQLHYLIRKIDVRYLIIDSREKSYYEESRILSDKCINIPKSKIKEGILGFHFEKCFAKDKHSRDLFVNRSAQYIDVLVLLDWNATQKTIASNDSINLLKIIFENWDPGMKHKNIKILNGGYHEWLKRYRKYTTNPNPTMFESQSRSQIQFIIPNTTFGRKWMIPFDKETEIVKEKQRKKSKINNITSSNKVINIKINQDDKSATLVSASQSKILSSQVPQNEVSAEPVIDHSNKLSTLKTYDPRYKEVLRFMKELNELARAKLVNELCQEYELYLQREDKHNTSDEKYLRAEIKSLKVKLDDMHKMYLKIKNEFKTHLKEADIINLTDDNEKKNLGFIPFLLKNEIKDIEIKRKKLQEEFLEREVMKQNDSDVHKKLGKTDNSSINIDLEHSCSCSNLLQQQQLRFRKRRNQSRTRWYQRERIPGYFLHKRHTGINNKKENAVRTITTAVIVNNDNPVRNNVTKITTRDKLIDN